MKRCLAAELSERGEIEARRAILRKIRARRLKEFWESRVQAAPLISETGGGAGCVAPVNLKPAK